MSALAKLAQKLGAEVSGSDRTYSPTLYQLNKEGIRCYVGVDREQVKSSDLIVYSSAVGHCDEELKTAQACGLVCLERHRFLGIVSLCFDKVVAIGGSHGKTTTTALISHVLKSCSKSFVAHIGGEAKDGNLICSKTEFVGESALNASEANQIFNGVKKVGQDTETSQLNAISAIEPKPEINSASNKSQKVSQDTENDDIMAQASAVTSRGMKSVHKQSQNIVQNTENCNINLPSAGTYNADDGNFCDKTAGRKHSETVFVTEACEYKRSFHSLQPSISLVTSSAFDHPDCYEDLADIRAAFSKFLCSASEYCIICPSDFDLICKDGDMCISQGNHIKVCSGFSSYFENCGSSVCSSGGSESDLSYEAVVYKRVKDGFNSKLIPYKRYSAVTCGEKNGKYSFLLYVDGVLTCDVDCPLAGSVNVQNCLFAAAVCSLLGVTVTEFAQHVNTFEGVKRRYEYCGEVGGMRVVFDYAHHPQEIEGAIKTARLQSKKLLVVFQPHTYSRTAACFDDFVSVLGGAGDLVLLSTFAARESEKDGLTALDLHNALLLRGSPVTYCPNLSELAKYVTSVCARYDMCLVLGAGDVYELKNLLF